MEIIITTFRNPFSFFGKVEETGIILYNFPKQDLVNASIFKNHISDSYHGQYVAVLWNNEWLRGVITMENQLRIWLVDCGTFIRPDDKTIFISLPSEYKNYPTKVFEASIHGVIPIDKILNEECQIEDQISTNWNKGALEKAQELISRATKIYFLPVALLSTKNNDVVLGDLYLEIKKGDIINIIDALQMWPVFLQRNKQAYIENLATFYTSRRCHHASQLKPVFPDCCLPSLTLNTTLIEYSAICDTIPVFHSDQETSSDSLDGSTVCGPADKKSFKLTPEEISKYSQMTVTIADRKLNVLNILVNKARDLKMCEQYNNFDDQSLGRACTRRHFTKN